MTVRNMVNDAIRALGGSTTNKAVRDWIWQQDPNANRSTIDCQMIAGCVNHPSRVHYRSIGARPRTANDPSIDVFFRPAKGHVELYDPKKHGYWEIFKRADGKLSVRETAAISTAHLPAPAATSLVEIAPTSKSKRRTGEVAWMELLQPRLQDALQSLSFDQTKLRVTTSFRLAYSHEIAFYKSDNSAHTRPPTRYETDLLAYDEGSDGSLVPRVVIECKLGGVTTHDALTYSGKAETHKHVHPYLRYGILVGGYGARLPGRLIRHGAYFDFMAVWADEQPDKREWEALIDVLVKEVRSSRDLESLLSHGSQHQKRVTVLHRNLCFV